MPVLLRELRTKQRVPSNEYAGSFGQNRIASTAQD